MDIITLKIEAECPDKNGSAVSALRIDPDPPGIVGEYIRHGNPYAIGAGSAVECDEDMLLHYLNLMSDINLMDDNNLAAIGFDALSKAREIAGQVFWASSGMTEATKRRTGEKTIYVDNSADEKLRGIFGHVINPEVGGQSLDQLKRMSFADVNEVIGMVNASNMLLQKASKTTDTA